MNWQYFPHFVEAWDVLWCDIVSVDNISHDEYDYRTVIFTIIFYRSLATHSCVSGLVIHTRRWVYNKTTLHSLCCLARVMPVSWTEASRQETEPLHVKSWNVEPYSDVLWYSTNGRACVLWVLWLFLDGTRAYCLPRVITQFISFSVFVY